MRISEISDENKAWIDLSGWNLNINSRYTEIESLLDELLLRKDRIKNKQKLQEIIEFEEALFTIQAYPFPDSGDPDVIKFIAKIEIMLKKIGLKKSFLLL